MKKNIFMIAAGILMVAVLTFYNFQISTESGANTSDLTLSFLANNAIAQQECEPPPYGNGYFGWCERCVDQSGKIAISCYDYNQCYCAATPCTYGYC
jgi:hypothetical protein